MIQNLQWLRRATVSSLDLFVNNCEQSNTALLYAMNRDVLCSVAPQ